MSQTDSVVAFALEVAEPRHFFPLTAPELVGYPQAVDVYAVIHLNLHDTLDVADIVTELRRASASHDCGGRELQLAHERWHSLR
jgi:hypothetical protein